MPDIDIDFCQKAAEVIDYVIRKYGEDGSPRSYHGCKGGNKDVGRALDALREVDQIAKMIRFRSG